MANISTPTLEKMQKIQNQSQVCGEFLQFLQKKYAMFEIQGGKKDSYYIGSGDYINTEKLLAEFFEIDLEVAEKERAAILSETVL